MQKAKWNVCVTVLVMLFVCCLTAAAAAEKKVSLHNDLEFKNGKTIIAWDVNEASATRYVVTYRVLDNGTAVQSTLEAGSTYANSLETPVILPGKCYEISVKDAQGNILDQKAYRMDDAETYTDGNLKNTSIKISIKPSQMARGEEPKQSAGLKAKEIEQGLAELLSLSGGGKYSGVRYQMSMPQIWIEREIFVTLAFEAPNGYLYVDKAEYATVSRVDKRTRQTIYWKIAGADFFLNLYLANGEIPSGKYLVHLYWDGKWVNTSNFTVK